MTPLCSGLDQIIVKVPSLSSPTQALYNSNREAAQLTQATTYLASFTLALLALKVSDSGLETAESLLKLVPSSYSSQCEPLVSGLKNIRSQAEHVRREGARREGTEQVANMETSSLALLSEVLGLHYIISILGFNKEVAEVAGGVVKEEVSEKGVTSADSSEKIVTAAKEVYSEVDIVYTDAWVFALI